MSAMMSIPNPILSAALTRPDHLALVVEGEGWSWSRLCGEVRRAAGAFAAQGVGVGDRVALLGEPSGAFVVALHALGWIGAVACPLPERAPAPEIGALIRRLEAVGVVLVGRLGDDLHAVEGREPARSEDPRRAAALREAREIRAEVAAPEAAERFWPLDEVRLALMTSGTTGEPRAVSLTTGQLMTSAFGSAIRLGLSPQDRWLSCLPLNHVGGLSILTRSAFYGTTVELMAGFEAVEVARALDSGRVSLVSLVPQMLEQVLDARAAAPFAAGLRCVLLGGGPAPAALIERCSALGVPVSVTWGMTEAASQICTLEPGEPCGRGDVGAPLAFARVDEVEGRLRIRGPIVAGGELVTADGGEVDARGRVRVHGRADDAIVSGGENIAPGEVEAALLAHEAVADAAVVGVPDEVWGHRPVAALVLAPGAARPSEEALRAWCRGRLAAFKAPDRVVWVESLPRGALGKLSRSSVRAMIARQDQSVESGSASV